MQHFKLVYDFATRMPRIGIFVFLLIFVAAGVAVFYYNKTLADKEGTYAFGINKRKYGMFFGIFFAAVSSLIAIAVISSNLHDFNTTSEIYKEKKYQIVEGYVENYHPMPESGHDTERFDVNGIHFQFSDYDLSDYGYNNAASKEGAIKPGLYVKIAYFNNGDKNVILILQTE